MSILILYVHHNGIRQKKTATSFGMLRTTIVRNVGNHLSVDTSQGLRRFEIFNIFSTSSSNLAPLSAAAKTSAQTNFRYLRNSVTSKSLLEGFRGRIYLPFS